MPPITLHFTFSRGMQETRVAAEPVRSGDCGRSGRLKSEIVLQLHPGHPAGCFQCLWTEKKQGKTAWISFPAYMSQTFFIRLITQILLLLTELCWKDKHSENHSSNSLRREEFSGQSVMYRTCHGIIQTNQSPKHHLIDGMPGLRLCLNAGRSRESAVCWPEWKKPVTWPVFPSSSKMNYMFNSLTLLSKLSRSSYISAVIVLICVMSVFAEHIEDLLS